MAVLIVKLPIFRSSAEAMAEMEIVYPTIQQSSVEAFPVEMRYMARDRRGTNIHHFFNGVSL